MSLNCLNLLNSKAEGKSFLMAIFFHADDGQSKKGSYRKCMSLKTKQMNAIYGKAGKSFVVVNL